MNSIAKTFVTLLCAGMLCSCHEKKESTVIIAPKPVEETQQSPTRMSPYEHSDTVTWLGRVYRVEVNRFVADSLPMVSDEQGHQYFDNLIRLKIIRPDGSEFFNKVFKKSMFNDSLDDHTRKYGVLLGMAVDRADGDYLRIAASVGAPDVLSDEYMPFVIRVSGHGDVKIQRDTKLEIGNEDTSTAGEEDEGV